MNPILQALLAYFGFAGLCALGCLLFGFRPKNTTLSITLELLICVAFIYALWGTVLI